MSTSTKRKSSAKKKARTRTMAPPKQRVSPLVWVVGGVVLAAFIVAIVISIGGETANSSGEYGDPAVSGQALSRFDPTIADPAVGLPAPEANGAAFDGTPVSILADGTPKAVLFLAHWCSHCQAEVPAVQAWAEEGRKPDGVDLVAVATGTNPAENNFPPSTWLEREGWTAPTLVDDEAGTVAQAFGLSGFPYWVFLDGDGNVVARVSGEIPVDLLDQVMGTLAAGA